MADHLQMDPARIARLRDPARLAQVDPMRALSVAEPSAEGPIVDVGAGVGYVALPFARRFRDREVVAVDILEGMLSLLDETARAEGVTNLRTLLMPGPTALPLDDDAAAMVVMLQVHHELDDPEGLMAECRRVLAPGAPIVIVDWKAEESDGIPKGGRRVPAATIARHLEDAGFKDVTSHDVYPEHALLTGRAP